MLSIIVAFSNHHVIGNENKIPWDLPKDKEIFKNITIHHTVIMGRKTFESIGHVLPNRKNIVFTRNRNYEVENPDVKIVHTLNDIADLIACNEEGFVIRRS